MIGTYLGRYHVVETLGEGGMAAVYKGYDSRLKRDVAIKVILKGYEKQDVFTKRFEREAMAVAQLTHPNIVQVIDYGDQEGIPYLVMEFIQGGTLKERMGKPIPWQEAAEMLAPIARALDYAHKEKIVHRDIKPANILVTKTGDLMLSDFGIAKLLGDDQISNLTGTGVGIGTPAYMAPEQGLGKQVDHRVDIYSLGVVFYEMITGRPPFEADTPLAVMLKHINAPLPRPRKYVSNIPEKVEQVLFKALAKDPQHRFQSMEEFAQALEDLTRQREADVSPLARETIQAMPPTQTAILATKRKIGWVAGLVAVLILICALSAGGIFILINAMQDRQSAPTQVAIQIEETPALEKGNDTPDPTDPPQQVTLTPTLEIIIPLSETPELSPTPSPSPTESPISTWRQGKLALVARNGNGNSLYVIDLTQNTEPILRYNAGDTKLMAPAWSPDSSQIAFEAYGGSMQVISAAGSSPRSLHPCRGPSWSSDGQQILCYAGGTRTFDFIEVATAKVIKRIDAPSGGIFPVWSPFDDILVFPAFEGDLTRIWKLNLDGALPTLLVGDSSENYAPSWSPDGMWIAYQSNQNSLLSDIWIMDTQGENKQRITNTPGSHWSRAPSWSPDGEWLAFVSDQAGSFGADYGEIFIVSAEGGEIVQVTRTGGTVYDWRVSWGR